MSPAAVAAYLGLPMPLHHLKARATRENSTDETSILLDPTGGQNLSYEL